MIYFSTSFVKSRISYDFDEFWDLTGRSVSAILNSCLPLMSLPSVPTRPANSLSASATGAMDAPLPAAIAAAPATSNTSPLNAGPALDLSLSLYYIPSMSTEFAPISDSSVHDSLYVLLAPFTGNQYRFLLACLKDPTAVYSEVCHNIGISYQTVWSWRATFPNFKQAMEAIKASKENVRLEYARLAFLNATPNVADAMVERAQGTSPAAQRAGERILETTGVLPKPGIESGPPNVQVNTFTYYLVQPGSEPKPFLIETTAKALPPGVADAANDAKEPRAGHKAQL